MKKKRFIIFTLLVFLIAPGRVCAAPQISAASACVIDAGSGRILYEKNAYEKRGMASTTKIMTAIVALEKGQMESIITVSENAAATEGSSIWIEAGEKMKLSDLLYGLLLASGNDAAVAIAEGVGGSVENFVQMMNEKAKEIGAQNTSFENPNGLTADNHYTTAYDLAQITRYAMKNEIFREIVSTQTKTIPWEGSQWDRSLTNHNKLLNMYEGCIGVKTGYTKACGRCLVSSAEREGIQLICVTLNDPNDWLDHQNLLDFGFNNYEAVRLFSKGETVERFQVTPEEMVEAVAETDFSVPLTQEEKEKISVSVQKGLMEPPIAKGEIVGKAQIKLGEEVLGEVNLLSKNEYEIKPNHEMWERFNILLKQFFTRE